MDLTLSLWFQPYYVEAVMKDIQIFCISVGSKQGLRGCGAQVHLHEHLPRCMQHFSFSSMNI